MGKAAGFEVEVRNIAWDGIFGGVATGQYDIVASSVTITPERQKQFDFSDPYYEVVQAVVLPAGKSIKSLADLKGKKVGGQIGTTGIFVMRKANAGADIKEYDDVGLAIQDLVGGRLDAVICDDPVAMLSICARRSARRCLRPLPPPMPPGAPPTPARSATAPSSSARCSTRP